jgi:hypothetical protein
MGSAVEPWRQTIDSFTEELERRGHRFWRYADGAHV